MSDNKNKKDYHDRDRVSLKEEYEIQYWSKRFKTDRAGLEKLVAEVGPMVKDIEDLLSGKV